MARFLKIKREGFLLFLLIFLLYFLLLGKSIYGGDSGDLVTAAWLWGIPHPPGYPLYTFISSVLAHFLPFYTPAWRVGLMSSFFSALGLAVFYKLLKKIIKDKLICLIGVLTLAFVYPFWLYSQVAEVFALNSFFAILLTYLFINFLRENNRRLKSAITFFLVFGLALAHHQTIILLLPAFLYLAYKKKMKNKFSKKQFIVFGLSLTVGFLFYLYPLFVCQKSPLVCWTDPVNIKNLLKLILRTNYGTFKSSPILADNPVMRFSSLAVFFMLASIDFKILGLILMVLGFINVYKKNKDVFWLLAISLLSCLFFIFYASFPLSLDFNIATFERFLIMPYIFMSLLLALGVDFIASYSQVIIKKIKLREINKKILIKGIKMLFLIIPLGLFLINFKKIKALNNDFTAEKMSQDLLAYLPKESILLLSSDTTVFDTYYSRYVLNFRPDIKAFSWQLLPSSFYKKAVEKNFPDVFVPSSEDKEISFKEFLAKNSKKHQIFISEYSLTPKLDDNWMPHGLVWQYLAKESQPSIKEIISLNEALWQKLSDPLSGNLTRYKNLFLADVLRVYYTASLDYASWLLDQKQPDLALNYFKNAQDLDNRKTSPYIGQGMVFLEKKDCLQAKDLFLKVLEIDKNNTLALGFLRKTALECFEDKAEAEFFENKCVEIEAKKDIPLKN